MHQKQRPATWTAMTVFAEDLRVGEVHDLGSHTVADEEIVAFAKDWDPQFFHIDAEAAKDGYFGGLIASGIHTLAVFQRLSVLAVYNQWATLAGRSLSDIRLRKPVRPGTELNGRIVIDDIRVRDEGRALVALAGTLDDDQQDHVLELNIEIYVARRNAKGRR